MTEEKVLAALAEKPLKIRGLLMRVSPSGSEEELHVLLMRMRDTGKVTFNIKSGLWAAAKQSGA
jgi:hypothetical protein